MITRAWLVFVLCAALLPWVAGCQVLSVTGTPQLHANPEAIEPPRTIAILPTVDSSNNPEMADQLRHALYQASAELPYSDVELRDIDARLAQIAARLGVRPDQLSDEVEAHRSVADLVLFSELVDVGRLYLILYAHIKIQVNVALVDTRTRRVLYRNNFTFRDRLSAPTVSILGLVENMVETVMHIRASGVDRTLEKAAQKIIGDLPLQATDAASGDRLRIVDFIVEVPAETLRAGDTIRFRGRGTPNSLASFSIGHIIEGSPMRETSPGVYDGSYMVKEGDDTQFAIVQMELESTDGRERLTYPAAETPFSIDTEPPAPARIARWWHERRGIVLELEPEAGGLFRRKPEQAARYHIYRRTMTGSRPGTFPFALVGATEEMTFLDQTAKRGARYEYYVVGEDSIGNKTQPGKTTLVEVP